jgi:hypothetical protein
MLVELFDRANLIWDNEGEALVEEFCKALNPPNKDLRPLHRKKIDARKIYNNHLNNGRKRQI